MTPRLSVIIATSGRPTLVRMLDSIARQADPLQDEVLVVGELGPVSGAIGDAWRRWPPGLVRCIPCPHGGDWGHTERNQIQAAHVAQGTHLVNGDDDDAFLPSAFAAIRSAIAEHPDQPLMFRMINEHGRILWSEQTICEGNHGTPQFVVPNVPGKLGRWAARYGGDFNFVQTTLEHYPQGVAWIPIVIYGCRQHGDVAA
jgi:hypothetical protein